MLNYFIYFLVYEQFPPKAADIKSSFSVCLAVSYPRLRTAAPLQIRSRQRMTVDCFISRSCCTSSILAFANQSW